MKSQFTKLRLNAKALLLTTILASMFMFTFESCKKADVINPITTEKYRDLNNAMHKLWADHMQYTYATVDAYFNNSSALQASLNRLLKNQEDIGAAIVPYYGQAAGDQLATLLKGHINGAVPVLEAAKNNDQTALNQAIANWRENGKEIADFLSAANPKNWEQDHMRMHMDDHLTQTIAYSVALLQKDYPQAVIDYDVAFNDMMHFAASLSDGIAKQFPDKF
ncbi:MAG TPA: hypothetical protein PKX92_07385 [Edaphocola sp.]|nr:hypothetical protein [Edaphocola sp.]